MAAAAPTYDSAWPRAGSHVVVHDHGRRLAAEVTGASADCVELRLAEDPLPTTGDHRAMLEYVTDERAYRLTGTLEHGALGHSRFLPRSRPVLLQRRAHMRSNVDVVMVLVSDGGALRRVGRTRNLSPGGALADFGDAPSVGERLRFSLVPQVGSDVIKGVCRVTRVDSGGVVALTFEGLTVEGLEELADFILRHR